jgi:hypothetical protein
VENISEKFNKIVMIEIMRKPQEGTIHPQRRKRLGIPRNRLVLYKN